MSHLHSTSNLLIHSTSTNLHSFSSSHFHFMYYDYLPTTPQSCPLACCHCIIALCLPCASTCLVFITTHTQNFSSTLPQQTVLHLSSSHFLLHSLCLILTPQSPPHTLVPLYHSYPVATPTRHILRSFVTDTL